MYEIVKHVEGKIIEIKWSTNSELITQPFWTSAFLLDRTLIDCLAPGSEDEFREIMDEFDESKRPMQCFVTHAHEDHAGCGKVFTEEYGLPVYAPANSYEKLKKGWKYSDYRQLSWGKDGMKGFESLPYPEKIITTSGKYVLEALHSPGHDVDLHIFLERVHQWAFMGDMMLPRYEMLFGKTCDFTENIKDIALSLENFYKETEGMDNLKMFVAGKSIYTGREIVRQRIDEIYDSKKKINEINLKYADFPLKKRLRRIMREMYGKESFFGGITHGELSRENFILSILDWN